MAEKTKTIGVRVTLKEAEKIETAAKKQEQSTSDFIRSSADLLASFDHAFLRFINDLAERLEVPRYLVIQNMLLTKLAEQDAYDAVYPGNRIIEDFMYTSEGVITGKELYDQFYDNHKRKLEQQIAEQEQMIEAANSAVKKAKDK